MRVWPSDLHETVAEAWRHGESSVAIAARVSRESGLRLTKNSVICRMHRSGIRQGDKPRVPRAEKPAPRKVSPPKFKPAAIPAPAQKQARPKLAFQPGRVAILEAVIGQCRWISGEPTATALVCGDPVKPGKSYCEGHCRLAYVPSRSRTDTRFLDFSLHRR